MASLIIGHGGILDVLRSKVPEQRWRVPAGEDFAAQADFLTRHPVRPGRQGIVLLRHLFGQINHGHVCGFRGIRDFARQLAFLLRIDDQQFDFT